MQTWISAGKKRETWFLTRYLPGDISVPCCKSLIKLNINYFLKDKTNVRCTRNEDCPRNELNVPFCCSKLGKCDACKGLLHDSGEDYQVIF